MSPNSKININGSSLWLYFEFDCEIVHQITINQFRLIDYARINQSRRLSRLRNN